MAIAELPRPDLSASEKNTTEYFKKHLSWAESILTYNNDLRDRIDRWFDGYNGIKPAKSLTWLTAQYGKDNKSQYITYRLGRTKIDLLVGEQLKRPLQATVSTINVDAMTEKMNHYDLMKGAMVAKEEIGVMKEQAGVDIMEGAPVPQDENDPIWQQMSFKDKAEDMMQIICDNQVRDLDVKRKIGENFKHCAISNRCFAQIERNETGDIEYHVIEPRDAIFEEIEGDDYLEKSPIKGCRRTMTVVEVLNRYTFTKEERELLNEARTNPSAYCGTGGKSRGYMNMAGKELMVDVVHIEWKTSIPEYYKIVPKTASQLALDPSENELFFPLDPDKYEANKEMYDRGEKEGKFTVEVKYKEEEYEATRIGGLIDKNMRRTFFQKRGVDNPAYILSSSYYGYVHGRVNGVSVPLQQIIENFDNLFDIVMYQINKELARAKGRVLGVDRAMLGQKEKLTDVMYRMLNDQIYDFDSSAAGNMGGRNYDPSSILKMVDLGLSDSFQYLLTLKNDIRNELNMITGINENRMGITAASSTATAQQSDIANSRTITEALFYGFSGFVQRVILGIVQSSAVSWAFYKLEKGEQILGSEKFKFLQITQDIGYRDYGVSIEDGSKFMDISQKIDAVMQMAINAKTIDAMDVMNVLLAETLSQKKAFLEEAMLRTKQIAIEQQQMDLQAQVQMQQQQLQAQIQLNQEQREDMQAADKEKIILEGEVKKDVDNNQARNKMFEVGLKQQGDAINKQTGG